MENKKYCVYCHDEPEETHINIEDFDYEECFEASETEGHEHIDIKIQKGCNMSVGVWGEKLSLCFGGHCENPNTHEITINYCPMCGRKLNGK